MTLQDKLQQELDRLLPMIAGSAAPQQLTIDVGQGTLQCDLKAIDAIGCSFFNFSFSTDRLANTAPEELKRLSEMLAAKLHYLLEPIRLIEIEDGGNLLQLRSDPPQKNENSTSYYELLAKRGGEFTLCRYDKPIGSPRSVVPANVTREVLCRLATDFVEAAK